MKTRTRPDGAVEVTISKAKPKSKREIRRVEIEPGDNGGAAVRCVYGSDGATYEEPSLKAYGSLDEALAGVKMMLGGKDESEDDGEYED